MAPQLAAVQPGVALHLVQRGAGACFFGEEDRLAYLERLRAAARECRLHAYVLMGNHVHLLLAPARAGAAAEAMRELGALAGDVDATPVIAARYLLACMRYIELNPVRAGIVRRAHDYRWSSYRANALGRDDGLVTPHACYCALGRTGEARRAAYRASFAAATSPPG